MKNCLVAQTICSSVTHMTSKISYEMRYATSRIFGLNDHFYVFVQGEENFLQVKFKSPIKEALKQVDPIDPIPPECPPQRYNGVCHMNMLRKMQASFSWDWGPAVPSVGIWKPVVLELSNSAVIRDVMVKLDLVDNIWNIDVWIAFEDLSTNAEGVVTVQIL